MYIGLLVFLFSFALYLVTLAPTVIWGDSAKFALDVEALHLGDSADSHPLFIILGKIFSLLPFELAYSMNLLSAVCASIAVFLVYHIIIEITNSKISAIAGSLALCVSHSFWLHAVITEVYDLNAAFLASIILFLLKWRKEKNSYRPLYVAAFLFGLGLTNHRIIALSLIAIVIFIFVTERKFFKNIKVMFGMAISFIAGSALFIYLLIDNLLNSTATNVAYTVTGEKFVHALVEYSPKILEEAGLYLSYLFYQFPFAGFLLGFAGIAGLVKKDGKLALMLLLLIIVNTVFFFKAGPGYGKTKYTFYISDYMVFSVLVGAGFSFLQQHLGQKGYPARNISFAALAAIFLLPLLLYNITPYMSKKLNIDLLKARKIAYRDNEAFFLNPSKRGYTGAEQYALKAFASIKPGSIIIADYTPFTVLKYEQEIKAAGKNILVVLNKKDRENDPKKIISEYYGSRDIYFADISEDRYFIIYKLREKYDFVPEGILYRVVKKT